MNKNLIITSLLGIIAIVLGAFATHILEERLESDALASLEVAIRYQMYHVIVLLFVNTFKGFSPRSKNIISTIFFLGILFFSGSIFAIHLLNIPARIIWFITPVGGILLIIGWVFMLISFLKKTE